LGSSSKGPTLRSSAPARARRNEAGSRGGSGATRPPAPGLTRDGELASGGGQRGDREPGWREPRFLTLVIVPALLAPVSWARQRRLRGVLELHVHHDDGRREGHLVVVDDGVVSGNRLPEADVVDPDLPQLSGAIVDVGERDTPALLVDEQDALRVGVLRQL